MDMTTTQNPTKCHGHSIDSASVPHVCTDLCTYNECCIPKPPMSAHEMLWGTVTDETEAVDYMNRVTR